MTSDDRLFVPLNSGHWYAFEAGSKTVELRGVNDQFNRDTIRVGRPVELRRGYSTSDSLWGIIESREFYESVESVESHDAILPGATREEFLRSARDLLGDYDEYVTIGIPDAQPGTDHLEEITA